MTLRTRLVIPSVVVATSAFCFAAIALYWWAYRYQPTQGLLPMQDVQNQAIQQLRHLTGHAPDAVVCAGPLEKKAGRTVHCTAHYGTSSAGFTAIASVVDIDTAACRISIMADRPYWN